MTRWQAMGRRGRGSKRRGLAVVVLAITLGATLPLVLGATGLTASLTAAHAPVASCSPPGGATPPVASSSPPCIPTLTVVPSAELADGQAVTVSGSGFPPDASIEGTECASSSSDVVECDQSTQFYAFSDGNGSFTLEDNVSRIINANGTNIDCALTPCLLSAADQSDQAVAAEAAIGFDPRIPPELTGAVAATDKVNTKTGVATITGTVTCTEPALLYLYVTLSQVYHRHFNFTNTAFGPATCTARKKPTVWKVTIPPGNGLFAAGKATVAVEATAYLGEYYKDLYFSGPVVLQPKT
jgi:hypothetical protein